ncbi:2755_t:CDS:2, partial [Funneliformis geosporum]
MSDLKLRSPEYFQHNEDWSLLGYLEYRKTREDFRSNKADEHFFYAKNLKYIAEEHENKKHREKAERVRPIDMSRQMITVVCCQATGMACSAQSSNQKLSSVNSFWLSICQNNYEERIELEKLRHAENTIRAVNEETEEVRSVSSSETGVLLKRKRQDDINCFDKGLTNETIRITNGTVVEESSSNSLMNISSGTSLTRLSYTEFQVVNEETGSEIKSIDDDETSLTQLSSYTESQVVNEETDSEIKSIDDKISPNPYTNISSETSVKVDSPLALAKEVGDKSKQTSKYINRDIASEALKAYQMEVLAGKKLIYEGVDVLDSARSNMNMKSKTAKSPICIGVINIHNPDCTKFLPENFKRFVANQLINHETKDIQFANERKIANFAVDCEEEVLHFLEKFDHVENLKSLGECLDENPINHSSATNDLIYVQNLFNHFFFLYKNDILLQSISESEFNAYVWTPLLKNAFLGKDDLKLSCGELASNSYEKLKEILDIGGRSAPRLDGKGLLKALGTEILVQEDGVLNTRSKRKGDLKKLEYCSKVILTTLFFALPSEAKNYITKIETYSIQSNGFRLSISVSKYLFENTIIMMDLQDVEVPRTVEGFSKLIMAVKVILSWKARTRKNTMEFYKALKKGHKRLENGTLYCFFPNGGSEFRLLLVTKDDLYY